MVRNLTAMRSMKITHKQCKNKSPAGQPAGRKDIYETKIKNQVDHYYRKYNLIGGMTENF